MIIRKKGIISEFKEYYILSQLLNPLIQGVRTRNLERVTCQWEQELLSQLWNTDKKNATLTVPSPK